MTSLGHNAPMKKAPHRPGLESISNEAVDHVTGDRNDSYGHPEDDFTRIGTMWSAILGTPVDAAQVALCLIALKIAREVHAPKKDSVVDGIGYWLTLAAIRGYDRRG